MSRLISRAESWEQAYEAFTNVNFAAFDFNTIKQSLINYIKLYFPESFNDYIESSEQIAIIETFAYLGELLAYRMDINSHENFLSTAQRKDSILRLARLVSYTASRALPSRGLVKITSISTTESVFDTNGTNLANATIRWNDVINPEWKEQFLLVMDRVLSQSFGTINPTDRFQLQDVLFEIYSWNPTPLPTGVFSYTADVNGTSADMELVPVEYHPSNGITERRPQTATNFTLLYGQDGLGDGSDTTGFFAFTKQGSLQKFRINFDGITPNQTYDVPLDNVNETDVWVNGIDSVTGQIKNEVTTLPYRKETLQGKSGEWIPVDLAHAQNVIFNTNPRRNKYEVETRDNNRVRIVFGDGEFADIPKGIFDIWVRTSLDEDSSIPQSSVINQQSSFTYVDKFNKPQTFTFTFSLISSLQNGSAAEDIDHVRVTAPAVYYAQDRMVNGEDYNVFMLQDPSILKMRAVNRTFVGDSKYIPWHDNSESYENVKIFGTDGIVYLEDVNTTSQTTSATSIQSLIEGYIQPVLSSLDMFVQLSTAGVALPDYRRAFTTSEVISITASLTAPPSPAQSEIYYNLATNQWTAIKISSKPTTGSPSYDAGMELLLPGWITGDIIHTPFITIMENVGFLGTYTVKVVGKRIIIESPSTRFWNTNQGRKTLDYDTLISKYDIIKIFKGNINNNRDKLLSRDLDFNVLNQETQSYGPNIGLPLLNKISTITTDENNDGIPDQLSLSTGLIGELINPKYQYTIPPQSTGIIPLFNGYQIEVPVYYMIDPTNPDTTPDVTIRFNGVKLQGESIQWGVGNNNGSFVSNKITLFNSIYGIGSGFVPPAGGVIDIEITDYVYFSRGTASDQWMPAPAQTNSISSYAVDILDQTNLWKRHIGRQNLNFAWFHYSPKYYLVDPSPTNIVDSFIITKGYYIELKRWLESNTTAVPIPPTPLDLRTTYGYLLDNKMISDTVVLHPGKIKLLFGSKADSSVRGKFKVIKSADRSLTDNQIKSTIVTTVRNYFDITRWQLGETFFFTELAAAIHQALPTEISSVVLVPTDLNNQFGDLFQVFAREDEIFYPDVSVADIEIIGGFTDTNLKLEK